MGVILKLCHWWMIALWVVMMVYWAIAALFVKRGGDRSALRRGMRMRLLLFVVIIATMVFLRRSSSFHALQWAVFQSVPLAVTGAAFVTVGAALAFTARAAIGRNWGSPAVRKSDTELVTSGPYKVIRHPIYSGLLLMMTGTSIGLSPAWWFVVILASLYFLRSARSEEEFMTERFPEAYPAYRARTKMLVPFLI